MVRIIFAAALSVGLIASGPALAGSGCFGKTHTAQVAGQSKIKTDKSAETAVKQSKPAKSGVSIATAPKKK